ncbi:MAG: GLPGLI family protein [Prevotellaceae bacterium]|jgi:GLPGLI family protein|nr:GLPGLI family protein [Prevotellaceae bacterium]
MRVILLFISFIFYCSYFAASQGLVVNYEEIRNLSGANLSQVDNPQIRAAIESRMGPKVTGKATLSVREGKSIYKSVDDAAKKLPNSEGIAEENARGVMNSQFVSYVPYAFYKNQEDKLLLSQAKIDGKDYLIEGTFTEFDWKIGTEKKEISGYQCIRATTKTPKGGDVIAWYTPDIAINDGPLNYWGLPGLILYLELSKGTFVYSCTSIEQVNDMPEIKPLEGGEKISSTDYSKMVAEKMQKLKNIPDEDSRGENSRRWKKVTVIE